ncbi:hypothetical protein IYZ83_001035 [Wolbachia pipientis]|uniref:hypothetical protein n=1 Tax=Wolbachia pipientis TaxID=955 RepID=UPI001BDB5F4C|nr:hypothetical protein [Wolbachia pipientis]UIP91836.1 hypothetical protein IYZ83_001035 [Wolbachia pipientis]
MKKMLGLNSKHTVVTVDKISQEPEVASSTSKVPANDSKSSETDKFSKSLDNSSTQQYILSKVIMPIS